jgi:hypothetical protein
MTAKGLAGLEVAKINPPREKKRRRQNRAISLLRSFIVMASDQ